MTVAIIITLLVGLLLFTAGMYVKLLKVNNDYEELAFSLHFDIHDKNINIENLVEEITEAIREINNIANRLDDNRIGQQERISLSKQLKEIANQLREVKEDVNSND